MVDVDHFKQLNDRHGHDVGDEVLKMVAARLARIRGGSTVFRYGGEEFCIVFPRKSLNRCRPLLEAARAEVEDYQMSLRDKSKRPQSPKEGRLRRGGRGKNQTISVTVSIGAAERNTRLTEPGQVLKAADAALYKAKQRGRNRVVC
jgi:PleD family two-component response regulator